VAACDSGREAYTAIAWGVGLSHESANCSVASLPATCACRPRAPCMRCSIATAWSSAPECGATAPTDFKGEFKLGNGRYCYPLTVSDHAARYLLLCEAFESTRETPSSPRLRLPGNLAGRPWRCPDPSLHVFANAWRESVAPRGLDEQPSSTGVASLSDAAALDALPGRSL
jgi:hypothetical protein